MRYSKMFIPTLREEPSDAEAVSHKLLLRGGYIRRLSSGLYIILPLGWRVIQKINKIIREEMNAIGAQEVQLPALQPAEIWQQTGRWTDIGEEMFRFKDRTGRDMCLGMTHEEIMTWLVSREVRSYRQLPLFLYQIQTKFRDEARPKSGILRTREFIMKDSYSFDVDENGLKRSYDLHIEAYCRIFNRCGLSFYTAESDPGMMGGFTAHEFMAPSPEGEDKIILCDKCGYVANVDIAHTLSSKVEPLDMPYEKVLTENKRTVEEVTGFLNISPERLIKSLLVIAKDGPNLMLLRGDEDLHEKKVQRLLGDFRPATRDEIRTILGVDAGYIGPMAHSVKRFGSLSVKEGTFVTGANEEGYHVKGIKPGVHFDALWHDIRVAKAGDRCGKCNAEVSVAKAIEIGNTFQLGTKYSTSLKAFYLDENGHEKPVIMGSYGIGVARIAAAAVEQRHNGKAILWPPSIAPFTVEVLPLNTSDQQIQERAEKIYQGLLKAGFDVLIDDRNERPGVKFNDADLIGAPVHVILGTKSIKEGVIEVKCRTTGQIERVAVDNVVNFIKETTKMSDCR